MMNAVARRRRSLLVALPALFLCGASALPESVPGTPELPAWRVFDSPEGRFRVTVPGAPALTTSSQATFLGPIHQARYAFQLAEGQVVVEHHDLPRIATLLLPSGAILGRAQSSLLEDVGGRLLESREVSQQGYPAREISYDVAGPPSLRERALLILAGNRLYLVIATWSPTDDFALPLARLLRSFELRLP
jgi:hypothetical protein